MCLKILNIEIENALEHRKKKYTVEAKKASEKIY